MTFPHDPERPQRPARQPDVVREPDRAAAGLQDEVVHAIFAVGLHLQSTAEIAADSLVRRRVEEALSDLDDLVCMIRETVFHLDHRLNDRGPRAGIVHLREHPPSPDAAFTGPVDGAPQPGASAQLPGILAEDLGYTAST